MDETGEDGQRPARTPGTAALAPRAPRRPLLCRRIARQPATPIPLRPAEPGMRHVGRRRTPWLARGIPRAGEPDRRKQSKADTRASYARDVGALVRVRR